MATSITWLWKRQLSASICTLFTVILAWCEPSNPLEIYQNHKEAMAEDFLHQQCVLHRDEHMEVNNDIFNWVLNDLQEKVISMGGRQIFEYGLPKAVDNDRFAREYCQEISYDRGEQQTICRMSCCFAYSRPTYCVGLF